VSREILAPVRKLPLANGGDFFMHAEHEKFAPGDLSTIAVCEKIAPPLFDREKSASTTAIY